jgi:hypothetical protein
MVIALLMLFMVLANLPFLVRRPLVLFWRGGEKGVLQTLLESLVLCAALLLLSRMMEASQFGSVYRQNWEFVVVLICLALVMAFPGFVYRFLWKPLLRTRT